MSRTLVEQYRRWFEYEQDAHRKTLQSITSCAESLKETEGHQKAVDLFAHVLAARSMWLYRFGVSTEPAELFPRQVALNELPPRLEAMETAWLAYLETLTDADLQQEFEYRSYDGGKFRNTIEDILTQLFGHSWYHRGQIAQLCRSIGGEPAVTDFVYWSRVSLQ